MIINSQNTEFGYELIATLPYANYLAQNKQLTKTVSAFDTKPFYFFSPEHEENTEKRSWYNTPKAGNIPNINIHKPELDLNQWIAPDFKRHYSDKKITLEKETVVICNRYNIEWNKKPINFFDLNILDIIFNLLKDKFQVVYIHFQGIKEYQDNAELLPLNDFEFIRKKHKEVIILQDIIENNSINETQLRLFAGCSKFITMNGGHGILASYFGGTNIIYSNTNDIVMSKENYPSINSFYRWYNLFGNSRIEVVNDYNSLISKIKNEFLNELPLINVLTRTHNRPEYFKNCHKSVLEQTYPKKRHIVGYHETKDFDYLVSSKTLLIKYKEQNNNLIEEIKNNPEYGKAFAYNLYLNELNKNVSDGWICYLDDDDEFFNENSLSELIPYLNDTNNLILWKVQIGNKIYPNEMLFGQTPMPCQVSGIGFCFHSSKLELVNWSEWKRADYRVIKKLYENLSPKWINKILTKTQNGNNFGNKKDFKIEKILTIEEMRNETKVRILSAKIGKINEVKTFSYSVAKNLVEKKLATFSLEIPIIPEKIIEKISETVEKVLEPVLDTKEFKPNYRKKNGKFN